MKFDYGRKGIEINIDPSWEITIFRPEEQKIIKNPIEKIIESTRNPLGTLPLKQIIDKKENLSTVCIVASDATRPVPSHLILKGILKELNACGIKDDQITILIATGLHRRSRDDEIERILGKDLKKRIKVIDHVATDEDSIVKLGEKYNDQPIYLNKIFYESDLKILTGYVEPHFFFGFSGGRKSIIPGIAGEITIKGNHSAFHIDSPKSRFGVFKENPMHIYSIGIFKLLDVDFIVNVCINENHKITKIAAGDLEKAHEYLVNFQLKKVFKEIDKPFDIVVCGNGGYPLDLNLYQAVKSMAIGEMAVKNNGTIISVNELSDGIGHDNFKDLIFSSKTPKKIYEQILNKEINVPDQWEIQILARILMKADIYVVSKLSKEEIGNIGLKYAKSVEEAIELALTKHGKNARMLFLPNGPQVLPLLKK